MAHLVAKPTWLRRLDLLPARWAWGIGIGLGALAGAALAGVEPRLVGALGFLALLGAASALAWSGELVAVEIGALRQPEPVYTSRFLDLVPIPGGTFQMGSPKDEEAREDREGPVHEVRLSSFSCSRYPVTRRLYAEIMGKDPGRPRGATDDRPVHNVFWLDAISFCNRLSRREKLTPCYRVKEAKVIWNSTADGYRLLTEAEWEYACRAGTTTRWSFAGDEEKLGQHAWYVANAQGHLQPVGRKEPNAFGLHDMHGNVWEWCWDWYGQYPISAVIDPMGPAEGEDRVMRGGAFDTSPEKLRSACRHGLQPSTFFWDVGFRCARGPSPP